MNDTLELTAPTGAAMAVGAVINVDKLDTAKPLSEIFQPYQTTLEKWEAKAKSLVVTEISQKAEMQMARVARLELKEARVDMDKTRKGLVENLKLRTSKIDGTAKIIRDKIESLEALLLESEQFVERYAAKVKTELKANRESEIIPLLDAPLIGDLSDLSESDYLKTLNNAVLLRQAKIDAAAKIEADRKAKEEADRLERERIAAENARLKAEAIAQESERRAERAKAEAERRAVEAKAKAEAAEADRIANIEFRRIQAERAAEKSKADAEFRRLEAVRQEERKKVEAERIAAEVQARKERDALQAAANESARLARLETERLNAELAAKSKAESEEKARLEAERKAQEKEAKRAAEAPDAIKLKALAFSVREILIPDFSNPKLYLEIVAKIEELAQWAESQIQL